MAFVGAILLIGSSLQAQIPGGGMRAHRMNRQRFMAGLNLTDAQKTQIKALREQHQAAIKVKAQTAMEARKAMRAALVKPETDTATLKALHDKVAATQFDMLLERRSLHQEILPLLTPDQRAQIEKRMSTLGQGGRWGHGGNFRGGPNPSAPPAGPSGQPS
jgi:Spy/CpxP family protein refolding chaperone